MYEVHSWRNAAAIFANSRPQEWAELTEVLRNFRLRKSHLVKEATDGTETALGGGRKSLIADSLDRPFYDKGWNETVFETKIRVDAIRVVRRPRVGRGGHPLKSMETAKEVTRRFQYDAPTHKVDCYKNDVAIEVEWNNKNPFFDRDLSNFRLLFDLRAIHVGTIITRCDELDEIFSELLSKARARERYGSTTTRMSKLVPLLKGGGGGGCPVLVFGISKQLYDATT